MIDDNQYSICSFEDEKNCADCQLNSELMCRKDASFRKDFFLRHLIFRATAILGLLIISAISQNWWLAIVYLGVLLLNFTLIEPRFLCSHCPFYAEKSKVLHCNTLYGMPKIWKYRPGPISKIEKAVMLVVGAFVDLYPLAIYIYGIVIVFIKNTDLSMKIAVIGITIVFVLLMIQFNKLLQGDLCKRCPNFSCAMNKTPKEIRDAYINKNPVIKEAWEKAGYDFD